MRLDQHIASASNSADARPVFATSGTTAFVRERRVHISLRIEKQKRVVVKT
jgi:hypothetical protein